MDVYSIATAMQNELIFSTLDDKKQRLGLTAIIARLYSLKGMGDRAMIHEDGDPQPRPSPEVVLAVEELTKELNQKYPYLTFAEIKLALESGVKGDLDDQSDFLSIANFCRWLSIYYRSGARIEAKQFVESWRRKIAPSNRLEYGTNEVRDDVAMRTLYNQLKSEVQEKGHFSEDHIDLNYALVYDWCRKTGEVPRPVQSDIDYAISLAQNTKARCTKTDSVIMYHAKRILLEEFLKKRR